MGYIIVMLLLVVATVAGWFAGGAIEKQPAAATTGRLVRYGSIVAFVLIFIIATVFRSFHSVSAGRVGVVYQFGNIVGQTDAGLVAIAPWKELRQANVQVQRASFDQLDSFTSETQDVFIKATINYQVSPKDIQRLYRTVGPDYFEKLVPNRVNQFFKDETVKYSAVEIAPNRDQIRVDVLGRLKTELAPYSIQVDDLLIDSISFSRAFTTAIEDKQIATQEAQAAQNRVKTAEYQAQQIIKTAQGQAEANRLKRQTLTPLLVQQNAIDKLNPNVQVILLPSNSNLLLPSSLFNKGTTP
jgi:regulator of protease activity HflC (stomatin/prohibitin superfamily)